jgi:hypothetical protein
MIENDLISRSKLLELFEGQQKCICENEALGEFSTAAIMLAINCRVIEALPAVDEPQQIIDYIDAAFDRPCGDSFWLDENGKRYTGVDVGYAHEWWQDCMKPELMRTFKRMEG